MYRGSQPRLIPIIIVIIVVALIVATLVTLGRMVFNGSTSPTDKKVDASTSIETALLDKTSDRAVRWTIRGPLVANEKFKSYQITINPAYRTYSTYTGYLDQVVSSKSYDNNTEAYEQFVYALDKAGITKLQKSPKDTDMRGVCATQGLAFMFETVVGDTASHTMWSSTCKESPGTMTASPVQIQALFVNQIPDFQPLFNKVY